MTVKPQPLREELRFLRLANIYEMGFFHSMKTLFVAFATLIRGLMVLLKPSEVRQLMSEAVLLRGQLVVAKRKKTWAISFSREIARRYSRLISENQIQRRAGRQPVLLDIRTLLIGIRSRIQSFSSPQIASIVKDRNCTCRSYSCQK